MFGNSIEKIKRLKQTDEVWEGTTRLARMWITPRDEPPYRPFHLAFVSDVDRVISTKVENEPPTPDQVCEAFFKAMRRPGLGAGRKRRPKVLALDDEEIVEAIRPQLAEVGVRCEYRTELPFITKAIHEMESFVNRKFPEIPSLLSIQGVTVPLLGSIFKSAAEFYHLEPWKKLQDETPIEIRCSSEETSRFAVVMGAAGESFGISVNDSLDDLELIFSGADPNELVKKISWFTLTYDIPIVFSFDDLDAISRHNWPVADEQAYPSMTRFGPTPEAFLPTRQDLFWLESALPALTTFFQEHLKFDRLGHAIANECTITVPILSGSASVYLRLLTDWQMG